MDARPRNLRAMLAEAKDLSELMVDLAYAALFFGDPDMAEEVDQLEDQMSDLVHEMRAVSVLAARHPKEAEAMASVLQVVSSIERIGNAAVDIARIVTHRLGIPRELVADLSNAEEVSHRVRIREGSHLARRPLAALELPVQIGMRVMAIRRERHWITHVDGDAICLPGDVIFLRGSPAGISRLRELAAAPYWEPPVPPDEDVLSDLDRAVDVLVEMKNISEVAVGLAYSALVLRDQGHDVVGVTMRLWGGESDTGCCSVFDVDDARRVAQQVGIDHLVFNFSEEFNEHVVEPYVASHVQGTTPNPCIECNRHLKFDKLIERGRALGFDAVATGHHARVIDVDGTLRLARGADAAKDQSYVVHMLSAEDLAYVMFPVGHMQKSDVRELATSGGLRTAAKPDSQDVCFIGTTIGRAGFLEPRLTFNAATVVDATGTQVGEVPAVELVTLGQRRGLGLGGGDKRYVVAVDVPLRRVVVGDESELFISHTSIGTLSWPYSTDVSTISSREILVQGSAHGERSAGTLTVTGDTAVIAWSRPTRRISPGQTVVFYDSTDMVVLGGGIVTE